jgi:hypothetical protein
MHPNPGGHFKTALEIDTLHKGYDLVLLWGIFV